MINNKKIANIAFFVWQFTWGIMQTAVGLIIFVANIKKPHSFYRGCIATQWNYPASVSLGFFIFITSHQQISTQQFTNTLAHEYGHCLQSLILGPLYLLAVGLPSVLWLTCFKKYRKKNDVSYYKFYTERWANRLGNVKY